MKFALAVSAFLAAFVAGTPGARPSVAYGHPVSEGGLDAFAPDGRQLGCCPLQHTEVSAEISGFVARVTVCQQFHNPYSHKIEAVYVFPLSHSGAVDRMTMKVGKRVIEGEIKGRNAARQIYERAKQAGHVAGLLDQQRANIFRQAVANIKPGERIEITIAYSETLTWVDGQYEFVFPMVVGPRYMPGYALGSPDGGWSPPTSQVPDADRISPPPPPEGLRAGHDVSLTVNLNAGLPILGIESKQHKVTVAYPAEDKSRAVVTLKKGATIPNKDFVLVYRTADEEIADTLLAHTDQRGKFFTLVVQPPQRVPPEMIVPKEMIFVIDKSGSMTGFPIETAKETMRMCIEGLHPHDTFNLLTFAGGVSHCFPDPVPNTDRSREFALRYLEILEGGGGTEMMPVLQACLAGQGDPRRLRVVCFMTDGFVGNDMAIIEAVRQSAGQARVFAFGIGTSTNRYLLDEIARAGRGDVQYVLSQDETAGAAQRFHQRVRTPLLTDVRIDFGELPVEEVFGAWPEDSAEIQRGAAPREMEHDSLDDLFGPPAPRDIDAEIKAEAQTMMALDDLGTPVKRKVSSSRGGKPESESHAASAKRRKKARLKDLPASYWPEPSASQADLAERNSGFDSTADTDVCETARGPRWKGLIAPDLFSSTPLVIKGRYTRPAGGIITLCGRTGTGNFERKIEVRFPSTEPDNAVLAPLWARAKVEHLVHQDLNGIQLGTPNTAVQEEILGLGLQYKLLTPYTSFVAVERSFVTEPGPAATANVRAEIPKGVSREGIFGPPSSTAGIPVDLDPNGQWTAPRNDLLREIGAYQDTGLSGRGAAARSGIVREGGGNCASESAVAAGLVWLAAHQAQDGSGSFHAGDGKTTQPFANPGTNQSEIQATSLALMAFLGAGQTHLEGNHKATVKSGLNFLVRAMKVQTPSGDPRGEEGSMLAHATATVALCEAYAMTGDKWLLSPAQLAINFITKHQDPKTGGWAPKLGQPPSTLVTAWHLMALKSGHMAYLAVDPEAIKKTIAYLDRVQADGGARYGQSGPEETPADDESSAAGLLCRIYLGWKDDNPALVRGVERLSRMGPSKTNAVFNFFATQVMRHHGGEAWETWNLAMRHHLVSSQAKEGRLRGSWFDPADPRAAEGGRLMQTTLNALTLEVYYRHLPLLRKPAADDDFPL